LSPGTVGKASLLGRSAIGRAFARRRRCADLSRKRPCGEDAGKELCDQQSELLPDGEALKAAGKSRSRADLPSASVPVR
jgi:hypothetical protein